MRRSTFILGFVCAPALVPWSFAQGTPDDDRIYDEVRRVLANDVDVKGGAFHVTVKDGAVTLEGVVDTAKGKDKATKLAKKVKGVKSVENKLKLRFSTNSR
jgi:osmotically-inducible protein OsmY